MRPVRLYAHRGAAVELPENTMESFARALEIGADALEMDGHLTTDGHVVISHDPAAARMCGVEGRFRDCRLEEVRGWDAGYGFTDGDGGRPFAGRGLRVPTLDEVLAEFPDVFINLDLKQVRPSMVEAVIDVVTRRGAAERVLLASFSLITSLTIRRAGYPGLTALPRAEIAALLAIPPALLRPLPWRGQAAQVPTRFGPIDLAGPRFVSRCRALGIRLDYWTINDPAEARRLLEAGADGIMTDDPAGLIETFRRWRAGQLS
jgi:glycerophosphoryl diester phosphodiesterase